MIKIHHKKNIVCRILLKYTPPDPIIIIILKEITNLEQETLQMDIADLILSLKSISKEIYSSGVNTNTLHVSSLNSFTMN